MRAAPTKTEKTFLRLLQKGYPLEIQKRSAGYVSSFSGGEIGGRAVRYDAARNMVGKFLLKKLSEDECVTKYGISPIAIQILNSLAGARR